MNWIATTTSAKPTSIPPSENAVLPDDLRLWVKENRLVCLALEAVQGGHVTQVGPRWAGCSIPMLMTLLSYAYACGIYGSKEVELLTGRDRVLRYLCAQQQPDWNLLRQFRRAHARPLSEALTKLLALAWDERASSAPDCISSDSSYAENSLLRWTTRQQLPDFAGQAAARITAAVRMDSMMLDD